jgi:hypothetical protein
VLEETHAPVILAQKLALGRESGAEPNETTPLDPAFALPRSFSAPRTAEAQEVVAHVDSDTGESMAHAFRRPLELLFFSRVCASCSMVIIFVAGTTNLIFASLGRTFQDQYGFSTSVSGLIYLAVTMGFVVATFVFGVTADRVSRYLAMRNQDEMEPEFRLPAMLFGLPLIAVGLVCYGWSTQYYVFWIVPTLGLSIIGIGITTALVSSPYGLDQQYFANGSLALAADLCG